MDWSGQSISTMQSPRSLLLRICQNQCHLPKHHALLWDIFPQASLLNLLNLVPLLLPPAKLPWLPQPLQQCPSLDLLQLPQPISVQNPHHPVAGLQDSTLSQVRLNAILGRPSAPQDQSQPRPHAANSSRMARVYPLTIGYTEALGPNTNSFSFASLLLVDLRSGQSQYLSTLKQLADALPKTEDPASRFALRGHVARPGQCHLRHSMRAAIWFLLPSDGTFLRDSSSLRYHLARQGWCAVLRGGDITGRPWKNCLNWIPDPAPATSRDHGIKKSPLPEKEEENHPPASHPSRIPRKI